MRKLPKTTGVTLLIVAVVLSGAGAIVFWPKKTDILIQRIASPDGKAVAELHKDSPGGDLFPTIYVTISSTQFGRNIVYARDYDCTDYSAFRVEWTQSNELTISYGECDPAQAHIKDEDTVENKTNNWGGVAVKYRDTRYLATR
jgi:hypothetical protein